MDHHSKHVPSWDGEPTKYEEFKERVRWYTNSLPEKDLDTAGPRIAAQLTGDAWRALEEITEDGQALLRRRGGERILLKFLEETLVDAALPEAGRLMKEYLFSLRRRAAESMKVYCQRARVLAEKLDKSFRRVEATANPPVLVARARTDDEDGRTEPGISWPRFYMEGGDEDAANEEDGEQSNTGESNSGSHASGGWWSRGWSWWWSNGYSSRDRWQEQEVTSLKAHKKMTVKEKAIQAVESIMARFNLANDDEDIKQLAEVMQHIRTTTIPPSMAGWLLLQRCGLSAQERTTVLASAKNDLSIDKVEKALKDQWSDHDLRERDEHSRRGKDTRKKGMAAFGEDGEDEEEPEGEQDGEDLDGVFFDAEDDYVETEDLEEEEREEAEHVMAVIKEAKSGIKQQRRTLAQARAVVRDIKHNRGYFQGKKGRGKGKGTASKGGAGAGRGTGPGPCFLCGGRHLKKDCPKNKEPSSNNLGGFAFSFAATFMSYMTREATGSGSSTDHAESAFASLRDETKGKLLLDSGATRSLASVVALEDYAKLNSKRTDPKRIEVDVHDRARFKFGNGAAETTASRADLEVTAGGKAGTISVHALATKDDKYVPMLGSINFLKNSKAVVDFETGRAIFKAIDEDKVVQLEEVSSGHLALDLTRDLFEEQVDGQSSNELREAAVRLRTGPATPARD